MLLWLVHRCATTLLSTSNCCVELTRGSVQGKQRLKTDCTPLYL